MSSKKEKHSINFDWPLLPGCVSTAMAKCGKKNCRCKGNPPRLHGPYYRWTGLIDGKSTTITLTKEEADECKRRIENLRRLKAKIDSILAKAIAKAPWVKRKSQ